MTEPQAQTARAGTSVARLIFRPVRWLLAALLSVTLLLILLLAFILGTQTGLRFAVAVAHELAPEMIRVGQVDGRVLGALALTDLELQLGELKLDAGRIALDWSPFGALGGNLVIRSLHLRDLDLVLPPPAPEEETAGAFELPEIRLPLDLDLGEVSIARMRLFHADEEMPFVALDQARLSADFRAGTLELRALEVALSHPELQAQANGRAVLSGDYAVDLELAWSLRQAPAIDLQGHGRIDGDLQALRITHQLSGSARAELQARLSEVIQAPRWDARLEIRGVDLPDFESELPPIALTGVLETIGDLNEAEITGHLEATSPDHPELGHLKAVLETNWAQDVLAIHRLELTEQASNAMLSARGQLDLRAEPGRFDIDADWQRLRWPLIGELLVESEGGQLAASGTVDAFEYRASVTAQGPEIPAATLVLLGTGSPTETRISELTLAVLEGAVRGEGRVSWSPELAWTLTLSGQDLNPQSLIEGIEDRLALTFESAGHLDAFDYGLEMRTSGPGLPVALLRLNGQGDHRRTQLDSLVIEALNGRIDGNGVITWDPEVTWDATLSATGLDPSLFAPEWEGNLQGQLVSQGKLTPQGPDVFARIDAFEGLLRGYVVAATGTVRMQGETLNIDDFSLASGPTSLQVQGQVDETLALSFVAESSDLTSLLPDARGALTMRGSLIGPRETPRVTLDLSARDASYAGQGIAALSGTVDLGIAVDDPFEIQIDGTGLVVGDQTWQSLRVRGAGQLRDHQFELRLEGDPAALDLAASGALTTEGAFTGRIGRLDLVSQQFGTWSLRRPSPLVVADGRFDLGPLCIDGAYGAGGCVELNRDAEERTRARFDAAVADFTLFAPFIPTNLDLAGNARLEGRFETDGVVLTGRASAEIPAGSLSVAMDGGRQETLDFSRSQWTLDASAQSLSARLGIPLEGLGQLDGTLTLPGWRLNDPARPTQALGGGLRADLRGLERISNLVPDLTNMTGGINVDLNLGGTIGAPDISGQAALQGGGFDVELIGLTISDLNLSLNAAAIDRFVLDGRAQVGGGQLALDGDGSLGASGFVGRMAINGTNLTVADTNEYFALVSPTLELQTDANGSRLRGEVSLPEARIRPRSIPAGVKSPSGDVVLIEKESSRTELPLDINVTLKLGNEVNIDAFGLRGRLAGELNVSQPPGRDMLGNGQLQIIDGQYRLAIGFGLAAELGAPLTIVQGRVIYANSPIDNPGLLLQAEREGGATVAGVQVLGTLRDPKLAFFSETDPGMSQAEITKFLLTGIAPGTGDQSMSSGLAIGTYITPKIFLEYDTGLGNQGDSVRMRYDLTNRIEIQTETGSNQGADIFFTFER